MVKKRLLHNPTNNQGCHDKTRLDRLFFGFQDSLPQTVSQSLAKREPSRVNVHLGDADEPQRGGEAEPRGDGTLTQQVGQLVPLLHAEGGVIEHPAVLVARLLDLQLVDVAAEPHELPRQLLVLHPHVCLMERGGTTVVLKQPDHQIKSNGLQLK